MVSVLELVPLGLYVTVHVAVAFVPVREQVPRIVPLPVELSPIRPVGVTTGPDEVSVTTTVQVVVEPVLTVTPVGVQVTVIDVERTGTMVTVSVNPVLVL